MEYYYLNERREPVGPVSATVMAALRQTGVVKGDTLVALDGADQWRPASVEFPPPRPQSISWPAPPSAPAPVPAVSMKRWLIIAGAAAAVMVLVVGAAAWLLLRSSSSSEESPASTVAAAAHASAGPIENAEPELMLGGIEPAPPAAPEKVIASPVAGNAAAAEEHALAEWYQFGHGQGAEIARAFRDLGMRPVTSRTDLMQMIVNLAVKPETISQPSMRLCFEGYEDGVAGKPVKYKPQPSQTTSLLPEELRIYTNFDGPTAPTQKTVLERALACTVLVRVSTGTGEGHGSGFYVAPGLIATNKHVVEDAETVTVVNRANQSFKAVVLEISETVDFALIGINHADHPFLELVNPDTVDVGDEVTAIGFPILDKWSATTTFGRISSVDRVFDGNPCFQIDVAINHGSSGGPLIDSAGRVIGMNTFILTDFDIERFNFAIKLDSVMPLIKKHTKARR